MSDAAAKWTHRSLFISDVHLGSRFCDIAGFSGFLSQNDAETIFLVGDTFDFWSLGGRVRWTDAHAQVLRILCDMMQSGARIIVIPGNHDDHLRGFLGLALGGIEIHQDYVHETAAGDRFLVVHGDEHDGLIRKTGKFARMACRWKERLAPSPLLARRLTEHRAGAPRRSRELWQQARRRFGNMGRVEIALATDAAERGLDGVISGHTHIAADRELAGVRYLNCGDWLGSSTAISESWHGEISLIRWAALRDRVPSRSKALCDPIKGIGTLAPEALGVS